MPRHVRSLLVGLLLFVLGPLGVAGQSGSVGYQSQRWSGDYLGTQQGGALHLRWPNLIELSVDFGMTRWTEQGSACVGLIMDPSACPLETVEWRSDTKGMALGYSVVDEHLPVGTVSIVSSLGFVLAHLEEAGRTTGWTNRDAQLLVEIGLAARYRTPLLWRLVGLFAEVRVSASKDSFESLCADCFNPLYGGATRRSVLFGLSVGR